MNTKGRHYLYTDGREAEIPQYYEVDDVNMLTVDKEFQLKVMHLNIQILPSKFDHLKLLLHRLDNCGLYFDFILLCETFLNNITYNQFKIPGYTFVQKNRSHVGHGGIVSTYVKT